MIGYRHFLGKTEQVMNIYRGLQSQYGGDVRKELRDARLAVFTHTHITHCGSVATKLP